MKQTAVEWLVEQWPILESQIPERILDQAKEMEKEQIVKAFDDGYAKCGITHNAQEYYNETYENTEQ